MQVMTQAEPLQCVDAVQTSPQPPQFELVPSVTQVPLQLVMPAGHAHTPPTQTFPAVQALLHAPQFVPEVRRSTHAPLQKDNPVASHAHAPALQ